jgi:hypothetical protein
VRYAVILDGEYYAARGYNQGDGIYYPERECVRLAVISKCLGSRAEADKLAAIFPNIEAPAGQVKPEMHHALQ